MGNFSNRELCAAVDRELGMRKRVYPRWVADNRMTRAEADRQIAMFEQIKGEYDEKAKADEAQAAAEEAKTRLI